MIRIKSIFLKLFITYIVILIVSHFIFATTSYLLFQNNLTEMHLNLEGINQLKYMLITSSIISITITGLFTYYITKRITAPLREMNRVALQIARGDFNQSVKIRTHDELGELGQTFNHMTHELASLDKIRKDFVANVSHDLRSPLTSIHGFATAFLDDKIPNDKKRHYYNVIKEQTERMIKLVNDILDMSQIESGQLEIRPSLFNLSELVRQVMARMDVEFVNKKLNVELISSEEQDIYVVADVDQIDQVIVNLIQNAVQFSTYDSSIEVFLNKGERAVVSIRDYGPGIIQEEIQAIWERFYKADAARTNKSGTGLGLSIVKHILDLHQTDIKVESEVGTGTTFTFSLPLTLNESTNRK